MRLKTKSPNHSLESLLSIGTCTKKGPELVGSALDCQGEMLQKDIQTVDFIMGAGGVEK